MNPSSSRLRRANNSNLPDRLDINEVASELVVKYGGMIMKDAIEFSSNPADAEDAYQRSVEILLTKAPTLDPEELIPWLRTVVRREARDIAIRHHNHDVSLGEEHEELIAANGPTPESSLEAFALLEVSAEAIGKLTPDQIKCVVAQNDGLEYEEIAQATGFSRRKVSRCLANARVAFARNIEAITEGSECERIEPLLHRLLDGDSAAAIEVRPHLRHCLACRARLREYENAPRRIGVFLPPALVLGGTPHSGIFSKAADSWQALLDRLSTNLFGAERWVEASGVKKIGVVAALATATVGGGVAIHDVTTENSQGPARAAAARPSSAPDSGPTRLLDTVEVSRPKRHKRKKAATLSENRPVSPAQAAAPETSAPAPEGGGNQIDDGSAEFLPEARGNQ